MSVIPKETSVLDKRNFLFDILFDKFEETPIFVYAATIRGKIKHFLIYYDKFAGHYKIDEENLHLQVMISEILSEVNEQIDLDGKTEVIYHEKEVVNNWFVKRKLTDITNYIRLFKEELVQRGLIKEPHEFRKFSHYNYDEKFVLINTTNSTLKVDLETSQIDELEFSPNFLFMSKLDCEYNPDLDPRAWDYWTEFLEDIIPNKSDREILQNWCAYSLINRFFGWQASVMLYGPLAFNGKTTFMNAFGSLFGDRCETITLADITQRFGAEKLANADFIIADESSAKFEDTSKLKQILEGANTNIEGKGTAAYTGLIDSKVIIATNKLSISLLSDSGIARRIEIITTPHSFSKSEDGDLRDELLKIKPTILYWAISSIPNMFKKLVEFKKGVRERTEKKYRDNEAPLNNFIAIYCDFAGEVYLDQIVVAYENYRERYQTKSMNAIQIGIIITNDHPDIIRSRSVPSIIHEGKSTTKYEGLSLNIGKLIQDFGFNQKKLNGKDWE